ncbi:MAG: dynamin family protein [Desulfatiglandales bacterium]
MKQNPAANPALALSNVIKDHPVQCPGLTPGSREILDLMQDLPKRLDAFLFKERTAFLWVVFLGGTGTGKSTLFNALCGRELSSTGVERPKTYGPVLYLHQDIPLQNEFPFSHILMERQSAAHDLFRSVAGKSGQIMLLGHHREEWAHLVLVDTPDVDSVEEENREITEDLYLLADAVVFVTSQEKYADEVPYRFLMRVLKDRRPCFFLLNKAQDALTLEDVSLPSRNQDLPFERDRMWLIPYRPRDPQNTIAQEASFKAFRARLLRELAPERLEDTRRSSHLLLLEDLKDRVGRLVDALEQENTAAEKWLHRLEGILESVCAEFMEVERERFLTKSREYLRREIRGLFQKYDVLAGPRRILKTLFRAPFHLLGFRGALSGESRKEALLKIRDKMDLEPILRSMDKFNALVLEKLSPRDEESPLFRDMRLPETLFTEEEIRQQIWEEQDRLDKWLEETFQKLSKELPRGKKWGIYSTSILWGILIIALETAIGGGFTVMDAALDSALAPFLTKGAVELFAYQEIQRIARDLAEHYRDALLSVFRIQSSRYEACMKSLLTPKETLEDLKTISSDLQAKGS